MQDNLYTATAALHLDQRGLHPSARSLEDLVTKCMLTLLVSKYLVKAS